jgi:deazaflavin-dependent oxidoreductase (nitroreductase family)
MPASSESLQEHISHSSEIKITVTGRSTGRAITIPVWFVAEDNKLYLLPQNGSDTQWYKNVLENSSLRVEARGAQAELQAEPITNVGQVKAVADKFRGKYGAGDVKKYYAKFDVAIVAPLS